MIILDSNVWVSFFNKNDSTHSRAKQLFSTLREKVLVPEYIILEVATIISQKIDKQAAGIFIEYVGNNLDVKVQASSKEFLDEVVHFYLEKKDRQLSFVDYSLLFLSQTFAIITFDKRLANAIKKLN
jgi:predicted nucleic acid-binding protein